MGSGHRLATEQSSSGMVRGGGEWRCEQQQLQSSKEAVSSASVAPFSPPFPTGLVTQHNTTALRPTFSSQPPINPRMTTVRLCVDANVAIQLRDHDNRSSSLQFRRNGLSLRPPYERSQPIGRQLRVVQL
ncbi:unnamed protein product, partial [Protopolystoma xenopodis]